MPTTAAPSGGKMCYDCGYLIDGWTQDGPNYQHPMTDGTPQAMPILKIDTNSYKGCPLKRLLIKFKKLLLSGQFGKKWWRTILHCSINLQTLILVATFWDTLYIQCGDEATLADHVTSCADEGECCGVVREFYIQ